MSGSDTIDVIRRGIQRAPVVTLSLTLTLLAFWIVLHTSPDSNILTQEVMERWGNTYLKVSQGELWRIFTYAFIHATPSHLAFNVIGILILGTRVERLIGHIGLMSLFLGAASLGGLLSFIWRDYELSIGASGALYGLLGAELVFMLGLKRVAGVLMERRLNLGFFLSSLWLLLGLFLGLLNELNRETTAVDTATHLASFLSGCLLGGVLLWSRTYRVHQTSLRGILSALSPLLMSLAIILTGVVLKPTPPGFGGFLSQLAVQEVTWRQKQRSLLQLSPVEQRALWAQELLPPLTEMTLQLDDLIQRRLNKQAPFYQQTYARVLSRYLNLWLEGARALSQDPLDPFAPPLARLRMELDQSRGRAALFLAEHYRKYLTLFREPDLLESKVLRSWGLSSNTLDTVIQFSNVITLEVSNDGLQIGLDRLSLLEWLALIQLIKPTQDSEKQIALRVLSNCLLNRLNSNARVQVADSEYSSPSSYRLARCQNAPPNHIVYGSLVLSSLIPYHQGIEAFRWLRFSLDVLTQLLVEPVVEESWNSPPTRLDLEETLHSAQNLNQLYRLWAQIAAQSLYDLLLDHVADPLNELSKSWQLLMEDSIGIENIQKMNLRVPMIELTWIQPMDVHEGPFLKISGIPPAPEGLMFGVYQEDNGQHWLLEVALPTRLTPQNILIPSRCDVGCAAQTTLFSPQKELQYDEHLVGKDTLWADPGKWVDYYHISAHILAPLPTTGIVPLKEVNDEEERFGWRAWPVGVSHLDDD